jgi:hypothetical protein
VTDPYSPPRILSPMPPDAAGSLADTWIPWLESASGPGIRLRKWQKLVLHRALLVDSEGRLIYRDIVVSTPRQSGKGWLAYALSAMRCHHAADLGGQQTVLHIANNLAAARRIHSLSWRWAEGNGLTVRRAMGVERVIWDDGSSWDICSVPAIWGASASVAIGDESWDLPVEVITSALQPTMVEREQSQLWLTSTANEEATPLMPTYRRLAIEGSPRTFIAEWSAPPDADPHDPAVWRAATPHWSEQRGDLMASAQDTRGFRYQWLNQWPESKDGSHEWLPGWADLGASQGDSGGGIGAVEVSSDRSVYGTAVACRREDGTLDVWTASHPDLEAACAWLTERHPVVVLAGLSVKEQVLVPVEVQGVGVKETRYATPVLLEMVRNGRLRHDHGAAMADQVSWARVTQTEYGDVLSAKASDGPIPTAKAVAWSTWAAASGAVASEAPAIF